MRKRILSIVLCLIMIVQIIMPSDAVAKNDVVSNEITKMSSSDERLEVEDLICVQENEYYVRKTITKNGLQRAKNILSDEKLSKTETNREILSSLGYEDYELDALSEEDLELMVGNGEYITITETYIKMDFEGNMIEITQEEYEKEEKKKKNNKIIGSSILARNTSNSGSYSENSSDSYLKMIVGATYQASNHAAGDKGWYYLYTTFRWLKMPKNRHTDIISLGVPGDKIAWKDGSDHKKTQIVYSYYYNTAVGETKLRTATTSGTIRGALSDGALAADCPIPHFPTLHSLSIYLGGMARVENEYSKINFNVSCGYAHIKVGSSLDVSISAPSGSISFSPKRTVSMVGYGTYCHVAYDPAK